MSETVNNGLSAEDQTSLISVESIQPTPDTISSMAAFRPWFYWSLIESLFFSIIWHLELVRRLKALTYTLLPVEVPLESLNDPTSRVITPQVISSYIAAAGDYLEAVCLSVANSRIPTFITHSFNSFHTAYFVQGRNSCGILTIILLTMTRTSAEVNVPLAILMLCP